jgi:hypothetical protein
MPRRIAKGRIVPQTRSTDPRLGRVSLKAATLYDRMWINADDQGRLSGDPDEIKYSTCPNLPAIALNEIPELLSELERQRLILCYNSTTTAAIQMLDWWREQTIQWAYPSEFSPPENWNDHLRYHPTPKEIITENWPPPVLASRLPSTLASTLPSPEAAAESERPAPPPPSLTEKGKEKGEGEGRLPSVLGSTTPSPDDLSTDRNKISTALLDNFQHWFGRVDAKDPETVIPRKPTGKELAQMRDLVTWLIDGGGVPIEYIRQAFREAAGTGSQSKMSVSYVKAILAGWLGIPKERSP